MAKAKKRGRPALREWVGIAAAARALDLSPYALAQLRPTLKAGHHYRCSNPSIQSPKGRRYQYSPERIQEYLAKKGQSPLDIQ
jgi:hypothetical protein